MRPRRHARAGAALFAAVLLGTTACSSDGSRSEPAADPTTEQTSAAAATLDTDNFVPDTTAAMLAAGTARVRASVDANGESITIAGTQQVGETIADNALDLTIRGGGIDGQMILVDKTLYVDLGQVTGGKFVEVDLDDPQQAALFGQLLKSTDTAGAVEALDGALEGVEVVGPAEVGGVQTTQYRLTVDTATALASQDVPESVIGQLPETLTYEMWVDEDLLLRKAVIAVASVTTTITTSEWGEPVDITAPPAAQISKDDPFTAPS